MAPVSSMRAAYLEVCRLGLIRGVDMTGTGAYWRVSLSKIELDVVIKKVHPSASIDSVLAHFKAKLKKSDVAAHAYYSLPSNSAPASGKKGDVGASSAADEKTIGWHSDPFPGALIQVYGTKTLEIGGIHIVGGGTASQSVPLEKLPPDSIVKQVTLLPNSIVGFGQRQIHCLKTVQEENLSLSVKIDAL